MVIKYIHLGMLVLSIWGGHFYPIFLFFARYATKRSVMSV